MTSRAAVHAYLETPLGVLFVRSDGAALTHVQFEDHADWAPLSLGAPNHARAVGHANARNPLAILVPCHRIVGASGALTGYAGGIERKRWLLAHERGAQA
jgi:methylated-DNA-[protein]-cysteine S-methyltransferase